MLKGLAVLRRNNEEVMVMDYVCRKEDMKTLFEKLENSVSASGGKTLKLWAPPFMADDLGRLGFSVRNTAIYIPRTTHETFLKKHEIAGNFFYTMGDTDFL